MAGEEGRKLIDQGRPVGTQTLEMTDNEYDRMDPLQLARVRWISLCNLEPGYTDR